MLYCIQKQEARAWPAATEIWAQPYPKLKEIKGSCCCVNTGKETELHQSMGLLPFFTWLSLSSSTHTSPILWSCAWIGVVEILRGCQRPDYYKCLSLHQNKVCVSPWIQPKPNHQHPLCEQVMTAHQTAVTSYAAVTYLVKPSFLDTPSVAAPDASSLLRNCLLLCDLSEVYTGAMSP